MLLKLDDWTVSSLFRLSAKLSTYNITYHIVPNAFYREYEMKKWPICYDYMPD